MTELERQIEAAYDFRGHVTITLKDGAKVEGFIFNRQFKNPKLKRDNFIEVVMKGSGDKKEFDIAGLESVALTGEDCAEGNSYANYLKKKAAQAQKS
ncbi:MAG: hypothetical protein HY077_17185 [Elusimicrobia bacterium]|nr:hypothetical protein [Elusimicrobiota bacterium]